MYIFRLKYEKFLYIYFDLSMKNMYISFDLTSNYALTTLGRKKNIYFYAHLRKVEAFDLRMKIITMHIFST